MFGLSFAEIFVVALVAVVVLGPDKLPDAMVKFAKFFKSFKKSINEAKNAFEQEINIRELKEDSLKYKEKLKALSDEAKKSISFDEITQLQEGAKEASNSLYKIQSDIKESISIEPTIEKKEIDSEKIDQAPKEIIESKTKESNN